MVLLQLPDCSGKAQKLNHPLGFPPGRPSGIGSTGWPFSVSQSSFYLRLIFFFPFGISPSVFSKSLFMCVI